LVHTGFILGNLMPNSSKENRQVQAYRKKGVNDLKNAKVKLLGQWHSHNVSET